MTVARQPRRAWSEREDEIVRQQYKEQPVAEIAADIDRTVLAVRLAAIRLGVAAKHDRGKSERNREIIKRMNAEGYTDAEISAVAGWSRRHVSKVRVRLGLPSNRQSERYRKRVSAKTREQCDKAGLATLADVRRTAHQDLIRRMGWPDHLALRSAQLAELLWIHGPLTRRQLATLAGVRWLGSKKTFKTKRPGGSYLAELQREGLVVQLRKAVPRGDGFADSIYMLAMGVSPCRKNQGPIIREA